MKKVLFVDRDGTILVEPPDEQVDSLEKLSFLPFAISGLKKAQELGYSLVMVSNQDGLGGPGFPESAFLKVQNKMMEILEGEGIHFESLFFDTHFPHDEHPNRKPGIGMLTTFLQQDLDLNQSYVIGDRFTDVILGKNIGCGAIWIIEDEKKSHSYQELGKGQSRKKSTPEIPFIEVSGWNSLVSFLEKQEHRKADITRNTQETKIHLELDLDGTGLYEVNTGIKFYDHMLEQLARHSGIDLKIVVEGDLEIDEHHTIEDSAIAIGQGFKQAMGSKRGMERYGFLLPMDEALVSCALDFSGRSYFIFKGSFDREYVGDFPTEMLEHWLKSFSDHSGLNLNLEILEGSNTHHKVEASFKALARCIKQAIKVEGNILASTKGIL